MITPCDNILAMRYITAQEAKQIDRRAQEEFGIPSIILMENAGRQAAEVAMDMLRGKEDSMIVCVCGRGNNGGDGFVAARHLINKGIAVYIFLIGDPLEMRGDARVNHTILQKMGAKIVCLEDKEEFSLLRERLKEAGLIIDAIFGVGLQGEVEEPHRTIIELINASGKPILSIDIPSGLDATEGKVRGICIKATQTITFALPKTGFIKNEGPLYIGKLSVADISIPKVLLDEYI